MIGLTKDQFMGVKMKNWAFITGVEAVDLESTQTYFYYI